MTEVRTADLSQGQLRYHDSGNGPPIVFIHGLLVDSRLWDDVVASLATDFRCIVPELPLGSHQLAMRKDADLSPPALADLIDELLAELDLTDVVLVGNDTGGAVCQLVATRHPERLGRLVLTNCDAYENFLPPAFRPLQLGARIPGFVAMIAQGMRFGFMQRLPIAYGRLSKRPISRELLDSWTEPARRDRGVRRDLRKVLRGIHKRYTIEAAEQLRGFDRPTLLAWGSDDRFFAPKYAERLVGEFPDARLEMISDSATFVPLDQPAALTKLIDGFAR